MNASALAARAVVRAGERRRVHAPFGRLGEQAGGLGQRGPGRGADRGVLVPEQVPGLDRPGHQLAVEQHPSGAQLVPEPGRADPGAYCVQQLPRERGSALLPGLAYGPEPKNGRPVRVYTAPGRPSGTPNRAWAVSSSRQASSTAREPMCFSSQSTSVTPSAW